MLDKLEFLLALSREYHFGRAAQACGVTQPTLSAGIKQLEQGLGVLLVHCCSRFMGLTAEGERVLAWARRLVGDARAMRDEIRSLAHGLKGHLRIAAIPTALAAVPLLTTPFRARHPDVRFTILSSTSTEALALLENLEVDAGLTYLDNEPLGRVRAVPLYRERYRLLMAPTARSGIAPGSPGPRSERRPCAFSPPTCRTGASSIASCVAPARSPCLRSSRTR